MQCLANIRKILSLFYLLYIPYVSLCNTFYKIILTGISGCHGPFYFSECCHIKHTYKCVLHYSETYKKAYTSMNLHTVTPHAYRHTIPSRLCWYHPTSIRWALPSHRESSGTQSSTGGPSLPSHWSNSWLPLRPLHGDTESWSPGARYSPTPHWDHACSRAERWLWRKPSAGTEPAEHVLSSSWSQTLWNFSMLPPS